MAFAGIDVGGTKTDVLIVDKNGNVLSRYIGGPGNYESLGIDKARNEIERSLNNALRSANLDRSDIEFAFFGMAGFDHEEDKPTIEKILGSLGLRDYDFDNDGRVALKSGTGDDVGIMVSCGTGSISYASDGKRVIRIGGYSWSFGEKLGSYLIAGMITAAVVRAKDGREYKSILVDMLESEIGMSIESLRRLSREGIYSLSGYIPKIISVLFKAYESHDFLATKILLEIVEEIVKIAKAHFNKLDFEPPVKLILEGTFFKKSPDYLRDMISSALGKDFKVIVPDHPPVVGAVLFALDRAGINSKKLFKKIVNQVTLS